MSKIPRRETEVFQDKILTWFSQHKRDLPWRKTRDPYKILVSEIMLQQTQVARVIPKYEAWLLAFPDITTLAKASTSDVLRLWSGLGYNRRAIYLQKTAKELVGRYSNRWPHEVEELEKLPGIGKYTAGAVACFAFDQQVAVVDTNIRKVILTKFCQNHPELREGSLENHKSVSPKKIQQIADQLLPKGRAYEWNQALMDYAAAVLKKEKIPITKQSTFKGSDRFYRGKVIRLLLEHGSLSAEKLRELLSDAQMPKEKRWLMELLTHLERDGLIKQTGDSFVLP